MALSKATYRKIDEELKKFPATKKRSAAIAALTLAQEELGWLSPETIEEVANYLGFSATAVTEVAHFYSLFNTQPVGKYKISICGNLPCEMNGSKETAQYLQKKLGITFGQTTSDGLFTLVQSECMGSCGDGPVILVNDKRMYFKMSVDKIDAFLEGLK